MSEIIQNTGVLRDLIALNRIPRWVDKDGQWKRIWGKLLMLLSKWSV